VCPFHIWNARFLKVESGTLEILDIIVAPLLEAFGWRTGFFTGVPYVHTKEGSRECV
jgi:hypothetical protein